MEKDINSFNQHGRRNYIAFTGIPDIVPDDQLEETDKSILSDIDVNLDVNDIENCHSVDKSNSKTKSKKAIARLVSRKYCKEAILNNNKKKIERFDNLKYNFRNSTKILINENLTSVNESIAFQGWKLKCNGVIHAFYTRNGVVHLKKSERSKPIKVYHMCEMYDLFPNFNFIEEENREDLFHGASQDPSQSLV